MATNTTTLQSAEYTNLLIDVMLQKQIEKLELANHAKRSTIREKQGHKVAVWSRWGNPSADTFSQVTTEGTDPSTPFSLTLSQVTATPLQYVASAKATDILEATEKFDSGLEIATRLGQDMALKKDTLLRNAIVENTDVKDRFPAAQTTQTWAGMNAQITATNTRMVAQDCLDVYTELMVNRCPMKGGGYMGILPPQVTRDFKNDSNWLTLTQYSRPDMLHNGEAGRYQGIRIIEATNPYREASTGAEGTHVADGNIYVSIFFGEEGFGTTYIESQSPYAPKIMVSDQPDKTDPANLYMAAAAKFFSADVVLRGAWVTTFRSSTGWTAAS